MKSINFYSLEEHIDPEKKVVAPEKKPVTFYELSSDGGESSSTPITVFSDTRKPDAVNFLEISDAESSTVSETDVITDDAPPLTSESDSSPEEQADEDPRVEASSKIIVVEDDNIVSTMLKHLLERRGFEIEIASDGRRASEIVENDTPPALVILDVMLPFVDGFELIRRIRSKETWSDVPIVMLTAKTRESDIVRALEAGADDYVSKPFQPQELIARVKRFVRKK